jgi:uncharacterized CHY-type Zn-finger protein
MNLPATETIRDWGGVEQPAARVLCTTCGNSYLVDLDYDVNEACPFCRSTVVKAVFE